MDSVIVPFEAVIEAVTVAGRDPDIVNVPADSVLVGGREADIDTETVTVGGNDKEEVTDGVVVPIDTVAVIGSVDDTVEVGDRVLAVKDSVAVLGLDSVVDIDKEFFDRDSDVVIGAEGVSGREWDTDWEIEMETVSVGGRDWVAVMGWVRDIDTVAPV